ncbi:MAG: hypothetical protein Q8K32_28600 [Archangium sp.]|nr:hypothetical protein [Archangium sp.]
MGLRKLCGYGARGLVAVAPWSRTPWVHLVLWRAFPTATLLRSQSSKVAAWVLTALTALAALGPGAAPPA